MCNSSNDSQRRAVSWKELLNFFEQMEEFGLQYEVRGRSGYTEVEIWRFDGATQVGFLYTRVEDNVSGDSIPADYSWSSDTVIRLFEHNLNYDANVLTPIFEFSAEEESSAEESYQEFQNWRNAHPHLTEEDAEMQRQDEEWDYAEESEGD